MSLKGNQDNIVVGFESPEGIITSGTVFLQTKLNASELRYEDTYTIDEEVETYRDVQAFATAGYAAGAGQVFVYRNGSMFLIVEPLAQPDAQVEQSSNPLCYSR